MMDTGGVVELLRLLEKEQKSEPERQIIYKTLDSLQNQGFLNYIKFKDAKTSEEQIKITLTEKAMKLKMPSVH